MARFIGHYNVLTPEEALKVLNVPYKNAKVVAIRPDAIETRREASGERLTFEGRVLNRAMLGGIMRYLVDCRGVLLTVDAVNRDQRCLQLDETIPFCVRCENVLEITK